MLLERIESASAVTSDTMLIHYGRIRAFFRQHYGYIDESSDDAGASLVFDDGSADQVITKHTRRKLYQHLVSVSFDTFASIATGAWSDDAVNWISYFNELTLGFDSEVPWRLAKNRLADPVFLSKVGFVGSNQCPFCPGVIGTAWHIIMTCQEVQGVWNVVRRLLGGLVGRQCITLRYFYCGYSGGSPAHRLANYILSVCKTTIYRLLTEFYRGGVLRMPFEQAFSYRIKSRLLTEFSWCLGKRNINKFKSKWCVNAVVCRVTESNELLFSGLVDSVG